LHISILSIFKKRTQRYGWKWSKFKILRLKFFLHLWIFSHPIYFLFIELLFFLFFSRLDIEYENNGLVTECEMKNDSIIKILKFVCRASSYGCELNMKPTKWLGLMTTSRTKCGYKSMYNRQIHGPHIA
jgi:hypothetical protein